MQNSNAKIKIVILAAGKGKRMQSEYPKVLCEVGGKPMIEHLLASIKNIVDEKPVAVIGHQAELVKLKLGDAFEYVIQEEQLGTGHAVASAERALGGVDHIVVLYGDQPFIKSETIQKMIAQHLESREKVTFATVKVPDFENINKSVMGFGRILRDSGKIVGIKEYRDASDEEKDIKEVNAGMYVFETAWLWQNLKKIGKQNAQGEYYLTDLIPLAIKNGDSIGTVQIEALEALGANSKEELEILEKIKN